MPRILFPLAAFVSMFIHSLCLYLKGWLQDWESHYNELLDYRNSTTDAEHDPLEVTVFSISYSTSLTLRYWVSLRKKQKQSHISKPFQLSARTRARIYNTWSLELLRKNDKAFDGFSDCVASIRLLSCFKAHGDPEAAKAFATRSPSIPLSKNAQLQQPPPFLKHPDFQVKRFIRTAIDVANFTDCSPPLMTT